VLQDSKGLQGLRERLDLRDTLALKVSLVRKALRVPQGPKD
jgi:hypothetical protein